MKNHTDVLMFSSLNKFRRLFVSERKQIALMADEKLHAQISHRLFATSRSEMRISVEERITLCGDNCLECPRYHAHTREERKKVAKLWYRIGWRDTVVSEEEIACEGCSSHKSCTYGLVDCTKKNGVEKCNQCRNFPCEKIEALLRRSKEYQKRCKEVCSEEEYFALEKAFFYKEINLRQKR